MSITVYTATFGNYGPPRDPKSVEPGVRYVCFTDHQFESDVWDIHYYKPNEECPIRRAKKFKINPHLYGDILRADKTIWIDCSFQIMLPITSILGTLRTDLGFVAHEYSFQNCIYREINECVWQEKEDPAVLLIAALRYRQEGHPENGGLPQAGIVFRNHTNAVSHFNKAWWKEISRWSRRDQISLPVILRRLCMPFDEIYCHEVYGGRTNGTRYKRRVKKHGHRSTSF